MKVKLLNDGGYGYADNVKFPVEVEALRLTDNSYFKISKDELHRVGFTDMGGRNNWPFEEGSEAVLMSQISTSCIREMCCNQFGERDEIQRIIDSLQADVVVRDERIKTLEEEVMLLQWRLDDHA